ncbi:hypothetical protein V1264_006972 [Littorina saxatilis]|uniref:Neurotransmitter-gated ion-channel ligand-binding domain-containing protein n=1 Tax=Littorina saxatilis TaxID=31220 RepID=A0AAN9AYM4_9CAEN
MAVFTRIILVACLAVCVSGAFKIRDDANGVPRSASEGDVIRDLLARHVKYGIPQPVGSLQVKLGLYVEAVTEVDVEKGTVEVVGFLSLQWEDPRLRFEHSDPFHEVKDVRLPASEVWRPDIELYTQVTPGMQIMNTARDQVFVEYNGPGGAHFRVTPDMQIMNTARDQVFVEYNGTGGAHFRLTPGMQIMNTARDQVFVEYNGTGGAHFRVTPGMQIMNTARDQVLVEYNGTVKWFPMVGLRTLCADLSFDKTEVHCALKFGSWTYQKHAMELAVNHPMGVLSQYRSTGQWTVSEATAERVEAKYECCPDTYVFVAYNLTLQKQDL